MEENSTPETEYQLTGNEECFTMQTPPGTQTPAGELTNKILLILTIAGIVIFGFLCLNRWINRKEYDTEIKEKLDKEYQEREQKRNEDRIKRLQEQQAEEKGVEND